MRHPTTAQNGYLGGQSCNPNLVSVTRDDIRRILLVGDPKVVVVSVSDVAEAPGNVRTVTIRKGPRVEIEFESADLRWSLQRQEVYADQFELRLLCREHNDQLELEFDYYLWCCFLSS